MIIKEDTPMNTPMKNKRGQGMIEYTIILAAVVALAFLLVNKFKDPVGKKIDEIGTRLQ